MAFDPTKGFRGNPKLKMPGETETVSPAEFQRRMGELDKIYNDIIYFASHYFTIINPDKGKCLIEPYEKQAELIKAMQSERRVICLAARQSGKCVCGGSEITVRSKRTGAVETLPIKEFYERCSSK